MKGVTEIWDKIDLMFIYENFGKMTWAQLLAVINAIRPVSGQVKLSSLRHQCMRMGLIHKIQIRWSAEDITYLKENYRKYGDTELAQHLNKRKNTFRLIDGVKVYRQFTKKHVEKKRNLLGLIRTREEGRAIFHRNVKIFNRHCFTSGDNLWTRGWRKSIPENETVVRKGVRYIKINGKLTPFARYFYHNFIAPIPAGHAIYHLDGDRLNDVPENLALATSRGGLHSNERLITAISLLKIREKSILEKYQNADNNLAAELNRVRALQRNFSHILDKREEKK